MTSGSLVSDQDPSVLNAEKNKTKATSKNWKKKKIDGKEFALWPERNCWASISPQCLFQKGRKFLQLYPDGSTESLNWPKPQLPPRGNVMVTLPPLHIFSAPALPLVNNCSKKHATNPQPGEPLNTKIKNSFPFLGQLGYE